MMSDEPLIRCYQGDRRYMVPAEFDSHVSGPGWVVAAGLHVDGYRAKFDWIRVLCEDGMEPLEVQRIPWALVLEAGLAAAARRAAPGDAMPDVTNGPAASSAPAWRRYSQRLRFWQAECEPDPWESAAMHIDLIHERVR